MNRLEGIILFVFGLFLLLFRSRISRRAMEDWARYFPRVKVSKSIYDYFLLIGGLAFAATGIMIMLGIIRPQ